MKRVSSLLLLMFLITACNKTAGDSASCTEGDGTEACLTPEVNSPPAVPDSGNTDDDGGTDVTPIPTQAETFDVNITFINFTATQQDKMQRAIELIKKVVATEAFKTKVLNHTYNGKKTYVDNGGFSNAQIYQKILDGAEKLQPSKNNAMDVEVELYYAATTTVGYTYGTSKRIWVNTKYFNNYAISSVANNLFHEWLHKLGFGHAQTYSTSRDYSVPYGIGDIVAEVGKQFL